MSDFSAHPEDATIAMERQIRYLAKDDNDKRFAAKKESLKNVLIVSFLMFVICRLFDVDWEHKGKMGLTGDPVIHLVSSTRACLNTDALSSTDIYEIAGQCATLPAGTRADYDTNAMGFVSGLNGYSRIITWDGTRYYVLSSHLDHQPRL